MGFWNLIGAAWRGAAQTALRNIPLFIAVLLIHLALNAASDIIAPPVAMPTGAATMDAAQLHRTVQYFIVYFIGNTAIALFSIPCMIAVYRHILLGAAGNLVAFKTPALKIAAILIGIRVAAIISALFGALISFFAVILVALTLVLYVRWLLAYPGIALDIRKPVETSFNLSKGRWWYIVGALVVGALPLIAADAIVTFGFTAALQSRLPDVYFVLNVGAESVFGLASIALSAAITAELFRQCGGMRGR